MVIRIIMRYLANNEQLVQRLAESYPIRRAAQLIVSAFYRTKSIAEERKLGEMTPDRFKSFFSNFKKNIREELEDAKRQIKKPPSK